MSLFTKTLRPARQIVHQTANRGYATQPGAASSEQPFEAYALISRLAIRLGCRRFGEPIGSVALTLGGTRRIRLPAAKPRYAPLPCIPAEPDIKAKADDKIKHIQGEAKAANESPAAAGALIK
jgi:hypothetical protein